jgi:hypothetical protein
MLPKIMAYFAEHIYTLALRLRTLIFLQFAHKNVCLKNRTEINKDT